MIAVRCNLRARGHGLVTGFNHTGIVVDDLDLMVNFYCGDLSLVELNRVESNAPPEGNHTGIAGSRRTLVFVGFEDDHRIELVKYHEPASADRDHQMTRIGTNHICFNVEDIEKVHLIYPLAESNLLPSQSFVRPTTAGTASSTPAIPSAAGWNSLSDHSLAITRYVFGGTPDRRRTDNRGS
ncbi:MAG: VOC family protein [Chloroflexota bacterium]|nr:VOC family protein [Chloroflexota bacterium]